MPHLARHRAILSARLTGTGIGTGIGTGARSRRLAVCAGLALTAFLGLGCTRGDARDAPDTRDDPPAAAHPGGPIGPGDYTVTSGARYRGRVLTILAAPHTRYGAQLRAPDRPDELYTGAVTVRPDGLVDIGLACDCPVRRDAQGSIRHEVVSYDGRYAARDVGGDRVELRQVDGPAVDTLARVR